MPSFHLPLVPTALDPTNPPPRANQPGTLQQSGPTPAPSPRGPTPCLTPGTNALGPPLCPSFLPSPQGLLLMPIPLGPNPSYAPPGANPHEAHYHGAHTRSPHPRTNPPEQYLPVAHPLRAHPLVPISVGPSPLYPPLGAQPAGIHRTGATKLEPTPWGQPTENQRQPRIHPTGSPPHRGSPSRGSTLVGPTTCRGGGAPP